MIVHIWTVPCRLSMVDQETNNVSLIGILEEVTIPASSPKQLERGLVLALLDVVTLWARDDDQPGITGKGRLTFVSPTGEPLLFNEYDIDLQEKKRFRSVGRLLGIPAHGPGKHIFRVERKRIDNDAWEEVASIPLWVNLQSREDQTEPEQHGGIT